VGKIKSQYGFGPEEDDGVRFTGRAEPVTVVERGKPALLIENSRTREILIPGSSFVSSEFSCLKWNAYGHVFNRNDEDGNSIEVDFGYSKFYGQILFRSLSMTLPYTD
jgi:hypothetical protein